MNVEELREAIEEYEGNEEVFVSVKNGNLILKCSLESIEEDTDLVETGKYSQRERTITTITLGA